MYDSINQTLISHRHPFLICPASTSA